MGKTYEEVYSSINKKCSTSLLVHEIQAKTKITPCFTHQISNTRLFTILMTKKLRRRHSHSVVGVNYHWGNPGLAIAFKSKNVSSLWTTSPINRNYPWLIHRKFIKMFVQRRSLKLCFIVTIREKHILCIHGSV